MADAPAVELRRAAKIYGRSAALRTVSLCLEPAQVLVLLGPNGSGKTTLLKILAGVVTPTLGTAAVFGHDVVRERPALRTLVGLLATESYLYDDLTARENLKFFATMAGRIDLLPDLAEALDQVALPPDERVRTFSSGMKRRLSLARVLLSGPRVLLLDEPYNSLDLAGAALVDEAVRKAREQGAAVILATHDVERGIALADEVAVLTRGSLSFRGTPDGFRPEQMHRVV